MRLLIVRHGDPDYEHDDLTEKGQREALLLRDRLVKEDITAFYQSPLGRAQATARPTLAATGQTAVTCDWLREFDGYAVDPKTGQPSLAWDKLPSFVAADPAYYDPDKWIETPYYSSGTVAEKYRAVCAGLDELLARHGYLHDGTIYRVQRENTDTVALFCHFGVECVLLSHLLHISPVALWHGTVALPSSVTTLTTEEREQGIASLRMSGFGDLSHLYAGGEPASFQARFCEVYSNFEQRH